MPRISKLLLSVVLVALSTLSAVAWAHATLLSSSPAAMAKLDQAPAEVVLKFSADIDGIFSSIKVMDANQKPVTDAKAHLDNADRKSFRLALPALQSGTYSVQWSAVTDDGHKQKGEFTFTVK